MAGEEVSYGKGALPNAPDDRVNADPRPIAKRLGLEVVESHDRCLQLDIDVPDGGNPDAALLAVGAKLEWLRDKLKEPLDDLLVLESKSKTGRHVYIRLQKPLPVAERIACQMWLGSDPAREMFSLTRALRALAPALCMFETVANVARIRAWDREKA